ncbi:L-threonylcarbamoyladenylate synthase [Chitinophaga pinensis]|uniref:L-threonylcarbamoyladenylate synthase n=1 Tax=Chitinophaga pinensis (strain ATCC 43595 / DSM 2588 / LMG 13176 / NBRC 15968 / NCIMB 11800 / UQM 2034) TaxID=485918 RepID=A0A979G9S1_CHIPD|nr:L-threonylcarbamoyladenylate synthase [Chitinophaga pinensis]ACU63376.1 Sua5/YciO/YrdC/YwlC family protein [Chitinophaga pinensis DSM 2588]
MIEFENDISASLQVLRSGGLILYPTDTIWGIGCDATDEAAVKKVFTLKDRPEAKSLVILLADVRDLLKYVAHPSPEIADILAGFDRPTTVIYEGALDLAPNVINSDGTVAIRIVKDTFCRHLIKRLRKPLVSTSANLSGQPSPATFAEVSPEIINGVDYVVSYRQDDTTPAQASRIIKLLKDGSVQVIR